MAKFVYSFNEGSKEMRDILGGKGANLAEMTKIGLPVPFGFTVSTEACNRYYAEDKEISPEIVDEIKEKLKELEQVTGKNLGDAKNPLLVSVRSGAVISMPGMMDTILNLGLNDETVEGLAKLTDNQRFAYDSYRRFIQMFSDVVMEIPKSKFDKVFDEKKAAVGADVKAVFRSWNTERAILYRKLNDISDDLGTAVNVQSMVFGNMGDTSGTGVAFTRSAVDGNKEIFGEFLVNAQGEDVVAGIRTPKPIAEMANAFPDVYKEFERIAQILEKHYKDMQDMEFTVENNKLFMLQTRNGKRTAAAAVKIAVDMVECSD